MVGGQSGADMTPGHLPGCASPGGVATDEGKMTMAAKRWAGAGTAALAVVLAMGSVSFADSPEQGVVVSDNPNIVLGGYRQGVQMTVKNLGGSSEHECPPEMLLAVGQFHSCGRQITVEGRNFVNSIDPTKIDMVSLYWVDAPLVAASLGSPDGKAEDAEATLCEKNGHPLGTAPVSGGAFSVTPPETVPPARATTPQFWYGTNAVCAVWKHTVGGFTHNSGTGARYIIQPVESPQ